MEQPTTLDDAPPAQEGLAGGASLLALGSAASRVLGLAREVMINTLFGPTGEASAFRLASQVPILLYDFLIGGMLSAAFVPVLSQHAQQGSRAEFGRLVGALAGVLGVLLLALVIVLELLAPQLGWLIAGGFAQSEPALLDLTVRLLRWSLPAVWFMCMTGLVSASLLALKRFTFPGLATGIYNLGLLCIAPLLAERLGIASLVVGMVAGTVAQLGVMLFDLWRAGVPIQFVVDWRHPALAKIGRLYLPIAAGIVVSLLQVGLDRRLATGTQPEAIAWMTSATTLQQLPLGLTSIAISLAALPRLSQYFAGGDEESYRATLARGLRMVLLLIVPAAVVLWILSEPIIRLLFEYSRFTPADTVQVAAALDIYVLGMLFAAIDYPLNFAFYARQNTRLPALVGVASVGFYVVAAFALVEPFGFLGLVWADTVKQIGHLTLMLLFISVRVGMRRELLAQGTLWIALAGLGAGLVMGGVAYLVNVAVVGGWLRDLALLTLAGGAGLVAYVLLLQRARVPELVMVGGWAANQLRRGAK